MVTGPRYILLHNLAEIKTVAKEEVYGIANMTPDRHVELQVHPSNGETEANIWISLVNTESQTN